VKASAIAFLPDEWSTDGRAAHPVVGIVGAAAEDGNVRGFL